MTRLMVVDSQSVICYIYNLFISYNLCYNLCYNLFFIHNLC